MPSRIGSTNNLHLITKNFHDKEQMGPCWHCCYGYSPLKTEKSQFGITFHILSHIQKRFFIGYPKLSLGVKATKP